MRELVEKQQSLHHSFLGYGIDQLKACHEGFNVIDTNVPVNDPNALELLKKNGRKAVIVPWIVLSELDVLKNEQDISRQVMLSIRMINRMQHEDDPNFYIAQGEIGKYSDLNPDNPDHHIIALCLTLQEQYPDLPLVLISNDAMVHVVAMRFGIEVEEYKADQVDRIDFETPLTHMIEGVHWRQTPETAQGIIELLPGVADGLPNSGAIFSTGRDGLTQFAGIRVAPGSYKVISSDIGACGISPYSPYDGQTNWAQHLAFQQVLDPKISLVTLHGRAGTGKTLLPIAAAIKQMLRDKKSPYRKIMIARPFIHLGNTDRMGFLKGDINAKTSVWLAPLFDNIDYLISLSEKNKIDIGTLMSKQNESIEILPLSYIRGRTLSGVYLIIDEAQNLTKAEVKTIVTRAGEDTKVVLVGDIGQIDIRWIDKRSSGLTHVTAKMSGLPYFANTYLDMSVRSQLAKDADERL